MKSLIFLLLGLSLLGMQSCYTAGYTTVGGSYFPYSQDSLYYEKAMSKFGQAHPELMLDTNFVRAHHKFENPRKEKNAFNGSTLYPLYPDIVWPHLKVWYIKSPDDEYIYELGLFACKAKNIRYNACHISLFHAYKWKNREIVDYANLKKGSKEYKAYFEPHSKEYKARNEFLIKKFETDLFPLMRPYFNVRGEIK